MLVLVPLLERTRGRNQQPVVHKPSRWCSSCPRSRCRCRGRTRPRGGRKRMDTCRRQQDAEYSVGPHLNNCMSLFLGSPFPLTTAYGASDEMIKTKKQHRCDTSSGNGVCLKKDLARKRNGRRVLQYVVMMQSNKSNASSACVQKFNLQDPQDRTLSR